jgi:hypothetical protein
MNPAHRRVDIVLEYDSFYAEGASVIGRADSEDSWDCRTIWPLTPLRTVASES